MNVSTMLLEVKSVTLAAKLEARVGVDMEEVLTYYHYHFDIYLLF